MAANKSELILNVKTIFENVSKDTNKYVNRDQVSKNNRDSLLAKEKEVRKLMENPNVVVKDLNKALVEYTKMAEGIVRQFEKQSPEMKKLTDKLNNLSKERSSLLSDRRRSLVGTKLNDKNEAINSNAVEKLLSESNIFKTKADGSLSKIQVKNLESYDKLRAEGKIGSPNSNAIIQFEAQKALLLKQETENLAKSIAEEKRLDALLAQADKDILTQKNLEKGDKNAGINNISTARSGFQGFFDNYDTSNSLAQASAETTKLNSEINKQNGLLNKTFKQFTLYAIALRTVKTAAREALNTIKELDKSLTEQAMVTGLSREQTYGLIETYQDLALATGATTKEIAEVATEYIKQGKTVQDSITLTEAAVSAAKVARVSVGDSVNYLTTALNGFQLATEEAMLVSDKFAAVAAASASDYDELAIALSKVASQANLAGMSIDYTTALLTKGLETTREAPETMGTALKTIIARMRELGDYGETLEDGMDINNLEGQLAYVDIQLRNTNGELRSTQEVLDELGRKWDTLNSNQQAALAKALAGTRQQSRLIALMTDYERVLELQQISERSAGATAAQMEIYMEGMEAAINRVKVSWESVITAFMDSEFIVAIIDQIGEFVGFFGNFVNSIPGMVVLMTSLVLMSTQLLSKKILEANIARQQHQVQQQQYILSIKEAMQTREQLAQEQAMLKVSEAEVRLASAKAKFELAAAQAKKGNTTAAKQEELKAQQELTKASDDLLEAQNAVAASKAQILSNDKEYLSLTQQLTLAEGQFANIMGIGVSVMALKATWTAISTLFTKGYNTAVLFGAFVTKKKSLADIQATAAQQGLNAAMWANPIGIMIGAIVLAVAAIALLTIGIIALTIHIINLPSKIEKTAETVGELNNEIYNLVKTSDELQSVIDTFEDLDNQLIKTNEDLEEMNTLLDSAADKLTSEQQEEYNAIATDYGKLAYLQQIIADNEARENDAREELTNAINSLSQAEIEEVIEGSSQEARTIMAGAIAENYNDLFEAVDFRTDLTDEQRADIESVGRNILAAMDNEDAIAAFKNGNFMNNLVESISSAGSLLIDNDDVSIAEILNSANDYSLNTQVEAYERLRSVLGETEKQIFDTAYSALNMFSTLAEGTVDYIDQLSLSVDELNQLYSAWENLQNAGLDITQEEYEDRFEGFLNTLALTGGNIETTINQVFGDILSEFTKGTEKYEDAFNQIVNSIGNIISIGILNMGQEMQSLGSSINLFYDTANKWAEMTDSERAEFISNNSELFSGEDGEALLKAFQTGNYSDIETALASNETLTDRVADMLAAVQQEIQIEEARIGDDRNEAYIAQLKEYEEYLKDEENLYLASLELRLEQETAQLDEYRSNLEAERDALIDSLEERKEAYEKYFEAINESAEDEDYEENVQLLINNLAKLGSSTSATARQTTAELENTLLELQEERIDELRERAQEAVLENMDTTLDEINEKFDSLLESNRALLAAMQGELENPSAFIASLIGSKIEEGATGLELEDYINTLEQIYGASVGNFNFGDIETTTDGNGNIVLNVNGQTTYLSQSENDLLYKVLEEALKQIGMR